MKLKKPPYSLRHQGQWCTPDERFFFFKTPRVVAGQALGGFVWCVLDTATGWVSDPVTTRRKAKALVEKHGR